MATPPPSQFAALLRRSKFASFDPQIGQVYTTFDGHAARGNFGLKRPLAIRRRNAHITVQAIDSREQQTVWRSAEQQNRWIRMWDETGATPTEIKANGVWSMRLGRLGEIEFAVDSDLVPREEGTKKTDPDADADVDADQARIPVDTAAKPRMSQATRNVEAMSDKEFNWYLKRLRELRPAFREYLDKHGKKVYSDEEQSLLNRSLHAAGDDFKEFLAHKAYVDYHAPRPRHIEQLPHRFAGLSYARSTPLQTQLIVKPHVGRILSKQNDNTSVVATAGMTAKLTIGDRGVDTAPATTFRFNHVRLDAAPATVGVTPEGLEGVKMVTTVRIDSDVTRDLRANPHPPGSKEYVAHIDPIHRTSGMTTTPTTEPKMGQVNPRKTAAKLLDTLSNIRGVPTGPGVVRR